MQEIAQVSLYIALPIVWGLIGGFAYSWMV